MPRGFCASAAFVLALLPALAAGGAFPTGVEWTAVRVGETPFDAEALPTLTIDSKGSASGSTGCNRFGSQVQIKAGTIRFGGMMQTKMFCHGAAGANEMTFSQAIRTATSWRMDGAALLIDTAKGPLRFERR